MKLNKIIVLIAIAAAYVGLGACASKQKQPVYQQPTTAPTTGYSK